MSASTLQFTSTDDVVLQIQIPAMAWYAFEVCAARRKVDPASHLAVLLGRSIANGITVERWRSGSAREKSTPDIARFKAAPRAKVRVAGSNHGNRRLLSGILNHNGPGYHKSGAFTFAKKDAARSSVNNFDFASRAASAVLACMTNPFYPIDLLVTIRAFTRERIGKWRLRTRNRALSPPAFTDGFAAR